MAERVDAVTARVPKSGLTFLSAAPLITAGDDRWVGGFKWEPELASAGSAIGIMCSGGTSNRTPAGNQGQRVFMSFLIWAAEKCSTKGMSTRDFIGRARRALEAEQSFLVDRELWNAEAAFDNGDTGNAHLAASTAETLTAGAVPVLVGLTFVDSALSRRLRNRQGMIHVRPEIHDLAVAASFVYRDSGAWFTPNGHIVVADAGATGDGPRETPEGAVQAGNADSQWIYGTDVMSARLGAVETLPSDTDGSVAEGVDRPVNNMTVWAQRPAGVQWDQTAHLAAEVAQGVLA